MATRQETALAGRPETQHHPPADWRRPETDRAAVTSDDFRDTLRHFPSGVTVVTIKAGGRVHGLTVSAFMSISSDPPLVGVAIDRRHRAFELMETEGAVFAVNILRHDQKPIADRFAWVKAEDRFAEGRWTTAVTGAAILPEALAWLDCTIHSRAAAGTHTVYVGAVEGCRVPQPDAPPLVYWNRDYRRLEPGAGRASLGGRGG